VPADHVIHFDRSSYRRQFPYGRCQLFNSHLAWSHLLVLHQLRFQLTIFQICFYSENSSSKARVGWEYPSDQLNCATRTNIVHRHWVFSRWDEYLDWAPRHQLESAGGVDVDIAANKQMIGIEYHQGNCKTPWWLLYSQQALLNREIQTEGHVIAIDLIHRIAFGGKYGAACN